MKILKRAIAITVGLALFAIPASRVFSQPKDHTTFRSTNTVLLNEEVTSQTVAKWISEVQRLDAIGPASAPIYLAVYSPGGDIVAGMAFNEALKGTRRPIVTVTFFAASMAFQIVQNAGERQVLSTGILMSHRAKGGFEGEFGGQDPSQLDSRYQLWKDIINTFDQKTVDRTNGKQTLAGYQKSYVSELWRVGQRAVNEGYADKVVSASCDGSLNGLDKHEASFMGMKINFSTSKCPMISGIVDVSMDIMTDKGVMSEKDFLAKGGRFDPYCLTSTDANKLCALDTSLNPTKLEQIKSNFRSDYTAKMNTAIEMSFKNFFH